MRRALLIGVPVAVLLAAGGLAYHYLHHGDLVVDARHRMAAGDVHGAELELNSFLRDHARDPEASYQLGLLNLLQGNAVAAERNLKVARDGGFDIARLITPLGEAYLRQSKYDDALTDFTVEKATPATKSAVMSIRASAYLALNKIAEARQAVAESITASPSQPEPKLVAARIELSAGDEHAAATRVDEVLAAEPRKVDALLLKGELAMHRGDIDGALKWAKQALEISPQRDDVRMAVARALTAQHHDLDASKLVDAVVKNHPRDVAANYLRVVLAVRQHDFETADAALTVISPVLDRLPQGQYFLAIAKLGRNQPAQAEEAALKYNARNPTDPAGLKLLAFAHLAMKKPQQAQDVLKPLSGVANPDADTLDLLARAQAMTGDMKSAEKNLARASAMQPENTEFLNRLAASRLGLGLTQAGEADLRRSLEKRPDQPVAAETLVQTALAAGDFAAAAATVAQLRKAIGDTEMVGVLDAQVKVAQLDLTGAKALYEDLTRRFPDSRNAVFGLVQAEGRLGDAKSAEARLAGWMANHPTDKQGLELQIKAMSAEGNASGALAAAEAAHAGDPADAEITRALAQLYMNAKQPERAVKLLDRSGGGTPNALLESLHGQALVQAGRDDDARKAFLAAQELAPNALGPRFGLLELALKHKDFAEARSVLDAAQTLAPGNPRVLEALVAVELKEKGLKDALALAQQLKADPKNMPAAMLLSSNLLAATGDTKGAADAALAAFHELPSPAAAAAAASALSRAKRDPEAQALLQAWLAQNPKDIFALQVLASYALAAGRWAESGALLERVLAQTPNNAVAMNNAAWAKLHTGDTVGAVAYAQRSYFLAPSPETEDTLGWALAKAGQTAKALPLLEQSAAAKPTPGILYHYAFALQAENHAKDARAAVLRALAATTPFDERADAKALLDRLPQ